MQLRSDQLHAHLQKAAGALKPVYTLFGDEPLLVQEAGDAIRQAARAAGYTERQVHTVSGAHFDWSSLLGAASEMSLFGDRQLIEIRIPSGKPGTQGSQALQQYCETAAGNDGVITLVMLPRLDKTQQGSAWFTALDGIGLGVRCDPIERHQLPLWIAQRLAAQGQQVEPGEAGEPSLPTGSRATCSPPTRKSSSWACCTHPARSPPSRSKKPWSMWRASMCSSSARPCSPAILTAPCA
jgi:DNA polymerase-3 subunit delta